MCLSMFDIQVLWSNYHLSPPSQGMFEPLQSRTILGSLYFILPLAITKSSFKQKSLQLCKLLLAHRLLKKKDKHENLSYTWK